MEKASVSPSSRQQRGTIVTSSTDNKAKEKYGDYVGTVLTFLVFHPNYLQGVE
jgi:hypothetical protein